LANALGVLLLGLVAAGPRAESLPLWELGAGLGVISFPDYRGSDQREMRALPFPYFNFRGERFRVGRQGVRGMLVDTERVELDFSMSGTPPVESKDNRARAGMEDLDPTFEFGPSLNVNLWQDATRDTTVQLRLPLRAAVATDFTHLHNAGVVFQPNLALDFYDLRGWKLGFLAGVIFADQRQHDYLYGVPAQYATAERPAYRAQGGYGGAYITTALRRRSGPFWLAAFARADTLNGAVFEDSPLVRTDRAYYAGIALSWIFKQSKARVESSEPE